MRLRLQVRHTVSAVRPEFLRLEVFPGSQAQFNGVRLQERRTLLGKSFQEDNIVRFDDFLDTWLHFPPHSL